MKLQVTTMLLIASMFFNVSAANTSNISSQAKSYVLMEEKTAKVISSSNADLKLPIASTTKIMTALIALEQDDILSPFLIDEKAIMVEGTSMGLCKGDKASLYTLSVGMLLASGNDAANAVAKKIGGSNEKFAEIMNSRAKKIGMKNTNFVTPSGLHDQNHYSTAYDMALLCGEALKNKYFAEICSKKSLKIELIDKNNNVNYRTYTNHNRLLTDCVGCVGVKTGFTKKAGRCLASAVTRDNITLICVTLSASDDWNLHKSLYNMGFNFVDKLSFTPDVANLRVHSADKNLPPIKITCDNVTLPIKNLDNVTKNIFLQKFYYSPLKNGDIVGKIVYYFNDREIGFANLQAQLQPDMN